MEKRSLEYLLGQGMSVEQIANRFGKDPSAVSSWLKKYGLVSPQSEKHAAKGGIERDRLEILVDRGMTIAEIAADVGLSKATVRHWLRKYGMRTHNSLGRRPRAVAQASKDAGLLTVTMRCARHGETEFFLEGRGYYRCKRCRSEAVSRRRRKVKEILVREAGGRCVICGYDRHPCVLQFHHLDPATKRIVGCARGVSHALAALREEARGCVLLCANCHAEVENGLAELPLE